jgi:hypothetical protein
LDDASVVVTGIWRERLDTLREVIRSPTSLRGDYFRRGADLSGAAGEWCSPRRSAPRTRAGEKPLRYDNVFSIFSVTKAFTNVLILKAIEEGPLRADHQGPRRAARVHRRAARRRDVSTTC